MKFKRVLTICLFLTATGVDAKWVKVDYGLYNTINRDGAEIISTTSNINFGSKKILLSSFITVISTDSDLVRCIENINQMDGTPHSETCWSLMPDI